MLLNCGVGEDSWESLGQLLLLLLSCFSCVWLFVTPWTAAHQASLSITNFWSLLELLSIMLVMPFNHLVLCRPLLILSSIFPSIRVFSSESALCIRWPNYRASVSASVLPMNIQGWFPLGLTGLISLLSKGLSRVLSNTSVWKHQFFSTQPSLWSSSHIHSLDPTIKNHSFWLLYGPLSAKWCLCFIICCLDLT